MGVVNWEPSRGKGAFVRAISREGRVLDVGCGNGSPKWFKTVRPDLYYVGVDVGDYNQQSDPRRYANEYVVCKPEDFSNALLAYSGQMNAVISSHNIEHCDEPDKVVNAMVTALKPGGYLYMAFPCEESIRFPKRAGSLNFYDDSTHQRLPRWSEIVKSLSRNGCEIYFSAKRYRPFPLWLKGLAVEPLSRIRRKVSSDGATWALYGFESIIWARKKDRDFEIGNWGPQITTEGVGANVQPDGSSACWIQVENVNGFGDVWVEYGNFRASATLHAGLVTSMIPEAVIKRSGDYPVRIVEASGRSVMVGTFCVKPSKQNT